MSTEIVIRAASLDDVGDADAIVNILDAYAREPVGGGRPLPSEAKGRLIAVLQRHPGTHVLIALVSGTRAGIAVCFVGLSTFAAQPLLNLQDLVVMRSCRGRGIGRLLLHAVEKKARLLGCCKLTLEVRADNAGARRLYRRVGYRDRASANAASPVFFLDKPL